MQRPFWRQNPHLIPQLPLPVASRMQFDVALEIVRGQARQRVRPVHNPTFLIGMADDCDLVLGDPQFPDVHAYIRISDDMVTLRHLGFTPQVTVNGAVATQISLVDGDRIRTGPYEFLVHLQPRAAGDDDTENNRSLRLPASMDRVEDEVANLLVQRLLSEIRSEMLPTMSRLKLFLDPESQPQREESTATARRLQEQHQNYARSS